MTLHLYIFVNGKYYKKALTITGTKVTPSVEGRILLGRMRLPADENVVFKTLRSSQSALLVKVEEDGTWNSNSIDEVIEVCSQNPRVLLLPLLRDVVDSDEVLYKIVEGVMAQVGEKNEVGTVYEVIDEILKNVKDRESQRIITVAMLAGLAVAIQDGILNSKTDVYALANTYTEIYTLIKSAWYLKDNMDTIVAKLELPNELKEEIFKTFFDLFGVLISEGLYNPALSLLETFEFGEYPDEDRYYYWYMLYYYIDRLILGIENGVAKGKLSPKKGMEIFLIAALKLASGARYKTYGVKESFNFEYCGLLDVVCPLYSSYRFVIDEWDYEKYDFLKLIERCKLKYSNVSETPLSDLVDSISSTLSSTARHKRLIENIKLLANTLTTLTGDPTISSGSLFETCLDVFHILYYGSALLLIEQFAASLSKELLEELEYKLEKSPKEARTFILAGWNDLFRNVPLSKELRWNSLFSNSPSDSSLDYDSLVLSNMNSLVKWAWYFAVMSLYKGGYSDESKELIMILNEVADFNWNPKLLLWLEHMKELNGILVNTGYLGDVVLKGNFDPYYYDCGCWFDDCDHNIDFYRELMGCADVYDHNMNFLILRWPKEVSNHIGYKPSIFEPPLCPAEYEVEERLINIVMKCINDRYPEWTGVYDRVIAISRNNAKILFEKHTYTLDNGLTFTNKSTCIEGITFKTDPEIHLTENTTLLNDHEKIVVLDEDFNLVNILTFDSEFEILKVYNNSFIVVENNKEKKEEKLYVFDSGGRLIFSDECCVSSININHNSRTLLITKNTDLIILNLENQSIKTFTLDSPNVSIYEGNLITIGSLGKIYLFDSHGNLLTIHSTTSDEQIQATVSTDSMHVVKTNKNIYMFNYTGKLTSCYPASPDEVITSSKEVVISIATMHTEESNEKDPITVTVRFFKSGKLEKTDKFETEQDTVYFHLYKDKYILILFKKNRLTWWIYSLDEINSPPDEFSVNFDGIWPGYMQIEGYEIKDTKIGPIICLKVVYIEGSENIHPLTGYSIECYSLLDGSSVFTYYYPSVLGFRWFEDVISASIGREGIQVKYTMDQNEWIYFDWEEAYWSSKRGNGVDGYECFKGIVHEMDMWNVGIDDVDWDLVEYLSDRDGLLSSDGCCFTLTEPEEYMEIDDYLWYFSYLPINYIGKYIDLIPTGLRPLLEGDKVIHVRTIAEALERDPNTIYLSSMFYFPFKAEHVVFDFSDLISDFEVYYLHRNVTFMGEISYNLIFAGSLLEPTLVLKAKTEDYTKRAYTIRMKTSNGTIEVPFRIKKVGGK